MSNEITFLGAGNVLRRYRTKQRLTIDELAKRMGINKSTLSRYETDEMPLSDQVIAKAAKALRVKATELMFDCLCHLQRGLKNSPFGKLMSDLVRRDGEEIMPQAGSQAG